MKNTRRDVLRSAGIGTAMGLGVLASSSTATATAASFPDGVNLQPAYYCDGEQDLGWDLMASYPDIGTVRIEIEPPAEGESQAEIADAKRWIDEAAANGYEVIATYHHHPNNGSADPQDLQAAADWWVEHYDYLSQDAAFTINLMNEWGNHDVTASDYAAAYNQALDTVRDGTNYSGPIVIDVPGWGGNTHAAADAVPEIDDDEIIVSAHVYPSGWNATEGEYIQPEHLDVLEELGVPCMIGEFGDTGEGEGDWSAVIDRANDMGWPVLGWAWNGDGENLNMISPAWTDGCSGPYAESSYFDTIYDKLGGSGSSDGGTDGGSGNDGGSDDTGGSNDDDGDYPTWDPDAVYTGGDRVSWNGSIWEAQWWTQNQEPGTDEYGPWETVGDTGGSGSDGESGSDSDGGPDGGSNGEPANGGDDGSTDDGGSSSDDVIAQFDSSTTAAAVGERITFQVEDTSGSGQWIDALEFDFGDGAAATGWWTQHQYGSAGSYTVSLTATDSEGNSTTYEETITVD